jgi:DNA-binding NarL/FixJ family response regulator
VTEDALRPDNLELLRQAGRNLRSRGKIPVVFGGLRDARGIRVTTTSGAATPRLTTIRVRPDVGLGGRSWSSGQPQVVPDYARADITHDFDPQILGEGITSLAVAPIIVRDRVAGLLYAGYRAEPRRRGDLDLLWEQAQTVARELLVRDRVDERMRALRAQSTFAAPGAAPAQVGDSELFARLRQIAARTTDRRTAAELRELLSPAPSAGDGADGPLTARQVDVLALVALGLTNDSIGASLGLSALTVKSYLRAAMTRLGAQTRYEAVVEARRRGLLP